MSLREATAKVLSSDPASNYLGTAATVLNPGIKKARQEYTCSPHIRYRDNMLVAYVNSKKASSAEIVRSMVLLAQLIKVPDRDELILEALRLLAKQDIEGIRLLGMNLLWQLTRKNAKS